MTFVSFCHGEPLLTIYKLFARHHLDYADVIYDQHYNYSFHQKQESIQYNAALAIAAAIRGSSREKLYRELGLEFLKQGGGLENFAIFEDN